MIFSRTFICITDSSLIGCFAIIENHSYTIISNSIVNFDPISSMSTVFSNPAFIESRILELIEDLEQKSKQTVDKVIFFVSNSFFNFRFSSVQTSFKEEKYVNIFDIININKKLTKYFISKENFTLTGINENKFIINDSVKTKSPIGIKCSSLKHPCFGIYMSNLFIDMINNIAKWCKIKIDRIHPISIALQEVFITKKEFEYGSLFLRCDYSSIDFAIFDEFGLDNIGSIPIGMNILTINIAKKFNINRMLAYKIISLYKSGVDVGGEMSVNKIELKKVIDMSILSVFEEVKKEISKTLSKYSISKVIVDGIFNGIIGLEDTIKDKLLIPCQLSSVKDSDLFSKTDYNLALCNGMAISTIKNVLFENEMNSKKNSFLLYIVNRINYFSGFFSRWF